MSLPSFLRSLVSLLFLAASLVAAESPLPSWKSPDGKFAVVWADISMRDDFSYAPQHFEIRDQAGKVLVSQISLPELAYRPGNGYVYPFFGEVCKVLWRPDSQFVAISTKVWEFATKTFVFHRVGTTFKLIAIPEFERFDDRLAPDDFVDRARRDPFEWYDNGDLLLDIAANHERAAEGVTLGYFAVVHFAGQPLKATRGPVTKPRIR